MQTRFRIMGALVCALSLFVSNRAEASYNYTTTFSISSPTPGVVIAPVAGGFTATLDTVVISFLNQAGNKAVPSVNSLNLGDVTVTAGTPAQSFIVNFTDTILITNVPPPGSALPTGTLAFSGTIGLVNVSSSTGTVLPANFAVTTGSTTAGGNTFVLSGPSFSSPTINGGGGNVSALITSTTAIPEPASIVMLGLGMGALGVVRLRRRFLAA